MAGFLQRAFERLCGQQPQPPVDGGGAQPALADGATVAGLVELRGLHEQAQASCLGGICGLGCSVGAGCFWAGDDAKGGC